MILDTLQILWCKGHGKVVYALFILKGYAKNQICVP